MINDGDGSLVPGKLIVFDLIVFCISEMEF